MSSQQEREIVKNINKLTASLPAAEKLKEIQPDLNKFKDAKKKHSDKIRELKNEKRGHAQEKKEKYEAHQEHFKANEEKKAELDAIEADI